MDGLCPAHPQQTGSATAHSPRLLETSLPTGAQLDACFLALLRGQHLGLDLPRTRDQVVRGRVRTTSHRKEQRQAGQHVRVGHASTYC